MSSLSLLLSNFLIAVLAFAFVDDSFLAKQKRYPRVRVAFAEKQSTIDSRLSDLDIKADQLHLYFRAFKQEEILEVWAKARDASTYSLYAEIPFCQSSGKLGPKLKEGDLQIPEGIYYIDRFNPASNFYLSLGINYPNASDLKHADTERPGGDIFIHGNCMTVGCIPITDDGIKEFYALAVMAKSAGQSKIPVHIFPGENLTQLIHENSDPKRCDLWQSLAPIHRYFDQNLKVPKLRLGQSSYYQLQ